MSDRLWRESTVQEAGFSVGRTGLFASKPAPTVGMRSIVGAGLLAKASDRRAKYFQSPPFHLA